MKPEDYPPQEPLGELAEAYHAEVTRRGRGLRGKEFRYGPDPYQSVVVHEADQPAGEVLLFMHGGGWTNGYKEWMNFMAPAFTAAGVTFVSAGYRLAPAHLFPAGFHDCLDAAAWIWEHIRSYGGDRDRLFVGGHSAGGHYAALMAVKRDWQSPRALPADLIKGCLPVSGVFDFGAHSGLSMRPRFLGQPGNERAASPIANIEAPPPPFLIAHGERDFPHLCRQAAAMEAALRAAGGEVLRLELPGSDHLGASYVTGDAEGPWFPRARDWLRRR